MTNYSNGGEESVPSAATVSDAALRELQFTAMTMTVGALVRSCAALLQDPTLDRGEARAARAVMSYATLAQGHLAALARERPGKPHPADKTMRMTVPPGYEPPQFGAVCECCNGTGKQAT